MTEYPFEGLVGSRQHRHRYIDPGTGSPVPRGVGRPEPGGNEYMFLEDLRMHLLPYGRGSDEGFDIEVRPADTTVLALIENAVPADGYGYRRLDDCFRDYLESAVWFLAQGDLYLEIEYFREPDGDGSRPVAFRVEFLHPELVTRRFGRYRYRIPIDTKGEPDVRWSSEPLDRDCLVAVRLPRSLRRDLVRALRAIRASDQDLRVTSQFVTGEHGSNSGFEFSTYQRISHDIVLRATRATGWAGRGLLAEGLLDPEKAWRALQFARLVVRLREIALEGLQEAINRAGEKIGFNAELALSRVLTLDDLARMENDLQAGTRPIAEMFVPRTPPTDETAPSA